MRKMPKHKYIARIVEGKTARYFYTMSEYKSYLSGNKQKKENNKSSKLHDVSKKLSKIKFSKDHKKEEKSHKLLNFKKDKKSGEKHSKLFDIRNKLNFFNSKKSGKTVSQTMGKTHLTKKLASRKINDVSIDQVKKSGNSIKKDKYYNQRIASNKLESFKNKINGLIGKNLFKGKTNNPGEVELKEHKKEVDTYQKNEPGFMKKIKEIVGIKSKNIDQATINPNFEVGQYKSGWNNNCFDCTTTYELRRRGYEVTAAYNETGRDLNTFDRYFETKDKSSVLSRTYGGGIQTYDDVYAMEDIMASHPVGSRGNLCVYWREGGGHSMAWENTKNGLVIRDCQTNQIYYGYDQIAENILVHTNEAWCVRTDDLKLKKDVLKSTREYSTTKKKKKK